MAGSKWQLWWKMVKKGLSNPRQLVKVWSWNHLKTLWFALRHEPPRLIWQNFLHLLQNKGDREKLHFRQSEIDHPAFRLYFERVKRLDHSLILSGWMLQKNIPITHVDVLADGSAIGVFQAGIDRPDLLRRFGTTATSAGFDFVGSCPSEVETFSCLIHFADHSTHQVVVPEITPEQSYQTHLLYTEPDEECIRRIRRTLRSVKKQLPGFAVRATDTQWAILDPDEHKYPFPVSRASSLPVAAYFVQLAPESTPATPLLWKLAQQIVHCEAPPHLLYWDEDELLPSGKRQNPHFKPAFDLQYLLSWNYLGYNFCFRSDLASLPDHDLLHPLQIYRPDTNVRIVRIPSVLSHSKEVDTRIPQLEAQVRNEYLQRYAPNKTLTRGIFQETWWIRNPVNLDLGVTIIIPFRDKVEVLRQCLESMERFNTHPNTSVCLVDNQSKEPETLAYLQRVTKENQRINVLHYDAPFNYAALHNWAIQQVETPYTLLLNNDTEFIQEGTIEVLLEFAQQQQVGAVGAKLLYPDNTIQHAGVIVGIGGVADHAHKHLPNNSAGYFYRANTVQQFSACTAACLLFPTELYREVGGMDEKCFPIAFNDVDLCLAFRQNGYQIIYTPHAVLYHHESVSRGTDLTPEQKARARSEIQAFQKKWRTFLAQGDPFYHPQLSIRSGHFELARS